MPQQLRLIIAAAAQSLSAHRSPSYNIAGNFVFVNRFYHKSCINTSIACSLSKFEAMKRLSDIIFIIERRNAAFDMFQSGLR